LAKTFRTIGRHKLLLVVGILIIAALMVFLFYKPGGGEKMVASGVISVSANSMTDLFSYSGSSVNQNMTTGCNVPASMKIICQTMVNSGAITVYINDKSYATGPVAATGDVMLSSGCGCSTVCICEIKIGENTIKISSNEFVGQLKYEIYVKS